MIHKLWTNCSKILYFWTIQCRNPEHNFWERNPRIKILDKLLETKSGTLFSLPRGFNFYYLVGEDEITKLLPHKATQSPPVIRSYTTESKTKTNKGYEEHKLKLALQQSTSNSSKSSKNDSLKRPPSYNTVTGGTTTTESGLGSGLGSGAQVISSREFDQMRRNSQSIGESGLIGQFGMFSVGQARSSWEGRGRIKLIIDRLLRSLVWVLR